MLFSEHVGTSLFQDWFESPGHLVRVLDLPQVHGGQHGLGQLGPHGVGARCWGQNQLSIVNVLEYSIVGAEEDDGGDG